MDKSQDVENGFVSITGLIKKNRVYKRRISGTISKDKIYIYQYVSKEKTGGRNQLVFNLGINVMKRASIIAGDYIEALHNERNGLWWLRRTNDIGLGYKIGPQGGKDGSANMFTFKMNCPEGLLKIKGVMASTDITFNEKGIFAKFEPLQK